MQLKQSCDRVKYIHEQSGWGWNNKKNLPKVSNETRDSYVKVSDILLSHMIMLHIYLQAHPKSKQWHTKPFPLYYKMAELVNRSHASGKWKFVPGRKATPGSPSIQIDPILLEKLIRQGKLGSDTDSDNDVSTMFPILAPSHCQSISRAMPPRTQMKIRPILTMSLEAIIAL